MAKRFVRRRPSHTPHASGTARAIHEANRYATRGFEPLVRKILLAIQAVGTCVSCCTEDRLWALLYPSSAGPRWMHFWSARAKVPSHASKACPRLARNASASERILNPALSPKTSFSGAARLAGRARTLAPRLFPPSAPIATAPRRALRYSTDHVNPLQYRSVTARRLTRWQNHKQSNRCTHIPDISALPCTAPSRRCPYGRTTALVSRSTAPSTRRPDSRHHKPDRLRPSAAPLDAGDTSKTSALRHK